MTAATFFKVACSRVRVTTEASSSLVVVAMGVTSFTESSRGSLVIPNGLGSATRSFGLVDDAVVVDLLAVYLFVAHPRVRQEEAVPIG